MTLRDVRSGASIPCLMEPYGGLGLGFGTEGFGFWGSWVWHSGLGVFEFWVLGLGL